VLVSGDEVLTAYTVKGGDLVFERDTTLDLSQTYAPASTDVTLLKGSITSRDDVTIEDMEIKIGTLTGVLDASLLFDTVYLDIGGSTLIWTPTALDISGSTVKFNGIGRINGKTEVRMYTNVKSTAPVGATFRINSLNLGNMVGGRVEYVRTQNKVQTGVGNIQGILATINATNLSITRTDGLSGNSIVPGGRDVLVNRISVNRTQGGDAYIGSLVYDVSSNAPAKLN